MKVVRRDDAHLREWLDRQHQEALLAHAELAAAAEAEYDAHVEAQESERKRVAKVHQSRMSTLAKLRAKLLPGQKEPPEIAMEEPELVIPPEPEEPDFEPSVLTATRNDSGDWGEVETPWGKALVAPGAWVISNGGQYWVVTAEAFEREYEEA